MLIVFNILGKVSIASVVFMKFPFVQTLVLNVLPGPIKKLWADTDKHKAYTMDLVQMYVAQH